jgi:hypothetical protein
METRIFARETLVGFETKRKYDALQANTKWKVVGQVKWSVGI